MSEELIRKCLKILDDDEGIDGVVIPFEKIGKDRASYFSIIFPKFSFNISSFIFSPRTLTIKRKRRGNTNVEKVKIIKTLF